MVCFGTVELSRACRSVDGMGESANLIVWCLRSCRAAVKGARVCASDGGVAHAAAVAASGRAWWLTPRACSKGQRVVSDDGRVGQWSSGLV